MAEREAELRAQLAEPGAGPVSALARFGGNGRLPTHEREVHTMNSTDIRRRFTDFFVERNHRLVPSSPLIPNDPTLLLANAGMNQFKPYFLGEVEPDFRRATSVQKCTRTSDIEIVGDRSHCTFFEMLGNFSFGDYFKEGAIAYAWELVTEGFGLEPDRLWATVYLDDDEAVGLWREIGVPPSASSAWARRTTSGTMGVPGPCGPCSEIHYDRGPTFGPDGGPASESDRYLEIWNLVFMQNVRGEGEGKDYPIIGELPEKNIDTGMGLSGWPWCSRTPTRCTRPTCSPRSSRGPGAVGASYGKDDRVDRSLRIVTEHGRTASFLIADGVLPSNEGRGYILRRLLRRSVRHLRLLGVEDPALARVCQRWWPTWARPGRSWSPSAR
jgi:alanyl-tRNA synthetase